uniref:S-layer homology domain-containing protein n=1 Tax=Effusibacillus pohliae TaxID=232270 RepID=UPI00058F6D2E
MKKRISGALAAALVLGTVAPSAFAATSFNDIDSSYAKQAILELADKGILSGVGNGQFNPQGTLTREQFATIVVKALGLQANATTSSFTDVSGWSVPYVEAAYKAGIIAGVGGGKFNPTGIVTREQAAAILVKAAQYQKVSVDLNAPLNFSDASQVSDWAKQYVAAAAKLGLVKGADGKFDPQGNATREAAAALAKNLLTAIQTANYQITPGTANLAVGQAQQFSVPGAKSVVWSVSGNGVIDQNGNFVGTAPGSATITAVADGKT